jgi:hypothetical protein
MKNQKTVQIILFFLFLLGLKQETQCQTADTTYYKRLFDASGIPPNDGQLNALATATQRLIDSLPEVYQDSFKVFDMGFYLNNENMVGGYPAMFQLAINQAKSLSKYYLLFGRQTDSKGINTKFWVDLKLPDSDIFYCIDLISPTLRSDLVVKFGLTANAIHSGNNRDYLKYHEAEIGTINALIQYVSASRCCLGPGTGNRGGGCGECIFDQATMEYQLIEKDFNLTTGTIVNQTTAPSSVIDLNFNMKVNFDTVQIEQSIQQYLDIFMASNPTKITKTYKIKYPEQCANFASILSAAEADPADLVVVAVLMGEIGQEGKLYTNVYEKEGGFIEPNGGGNIFLFDMFGVKLLETTGKKYHGIFFTKGNPTETKFSYFRDETSGDLMAKRAEFYLSDDNINYLKVMQQKATVENLENGGLAYLTKGKVISMNIFGEPNYDKKGLLTFDKCKQCTQTSDGLNGSIEILNSNYTDYHSKDFVLHWHSHTLVNGLDNSIVPSGYTAAMFNPNVKIRDFYLYFNAYGFNGDYLKETFQSDFRSPENTWRLPGRIGIIGCPTGIIIYRFFGDYYSPVPVAQGSISEYEYNGFNYKKQGENSADYSLKYTLINYSFLNH